MPDRPSNPAEDSATAPTIAPESVSSTLAAAGAARAAGAPAPGVVVAGTYEITRLLGQGGMGAVWEARHLRLPDKRVVVKVLLFGATDPVALARFRREAEIASRLGHPNIVQVLDFNTLPDGAPFIVMELLQGESLASRLQRGRPSFAAAMAIVGQMGSALAAAHREGIVHRDLKPDNVFLCPTPLEGEMRDVVKILDFGISKMRDAKTVLTQDAALIGTPQYMAPEQATGRNDQIDARTDVFAFGAIVFEMLGGQPPFLGDTLAAVIHAVVYAPAPSLVTLAPDTPPAVAAAVEQALAKDRDARFPDVGSFVKAVTARSLETVPSAPTPAGPALMPVVASTSMSAPTSSPVPAPAPPPTERVVRARPFPWAAAVVGVVMLAGGGILWSRLSKGPAGTVRNEPPAGVATTVTPTAAPAGVASAPSTAPSPVSSPSLPSPPSLPPPPAPARAGSRAATAKAEHLSPEAAADLAAAESALAAGRNSEAVRLAEHSLYAQKTSRAYAVIARARCAAGDLGNARAALAQVAARDRGAVVRACGKLGVDLH